MFARGQLLKKEERNYRVPLSLLGRADQIMAHRRHPEMFLQWSLSGAKQKFANASALDADKGTSEVT